MFLPLAFLSGSPGAGELLVLFLLVLVLFGPRRLPDIARMIGRALDELRRASQDFKQHIMDIEPQEPPRDPHGGEQAEKELPESDADTPGRSPHDRAG